MKRICICILIVFVFVFSQIGQINLIEGANIRKSPAKDAEIVDKTKAGLTDFTGIYGDWSIVVIVAGSDIADSKTQYKIWEGNLERGEKITVKGQGAKLRNVNGGSIGYVKGGAEVKIIKTIITWYELDKDKWVSILGVKK